MFRSREYSDKTPKYQPETALRVLGRKIGDWWLFPYNQLQFRNQVHNELSVWIQRPEEGVAPYAQFRLALGQKRTDKTLKCLR